MIPAGGLSVDHKDWIHPRYPFFLPVKALGRVFRGKFVGGLKRLYRRRKLNCDEPIGKTGLSMPSPLSAAPLRCCDILADTLIG